MTGEGDIAGSSRLVAVAMSAALCLAPAAHAQVGQPGQFIAPEAGESPPPSPDDPGDFIESGLPTDVERLVRFYADALAGQRPFGLSMELVAAHDSNINRATRADGLGTPIGDFTLDDAAVAQPGSGFAPADFSHRVAGSGAVVRGNGWLRRPLDNATDLVVRLAGNGEFYDRPQFDDYTLSAQAGPEIAVGSDRIALSAGPSWRWYGGDPYSLALGASIGWEHPVARRTLLRVEGAYARVDNRRDRQQDADNFSLSATLDRGFTARSGGGVELVANREAAHDPGYATAMGGIGAYGWRAFGQTIVVLSLDYRHLEADAALEFDRRRRVEDRYAASLAATFHALRLGPVVPLARFRWERNASTVEFYDFKRAVAELGIAAAF